MKKRLYFMLDAVLIAFLTVSSAYAFQEPAVARDVVYYNSGGTPLTMDIYYPKADGGRVPAVLYIHGGGWYSGDKTSGTGLVDIPELVNRGYLVAAVNYRLAPRYEFPAQIEDLKHAVRFLRANAATYGLDPAHIGVFGDSAGGHLAALLGVTDDNYGFDGVLSGIEPSTRVQAVVDMFGPADLTLKFERDRSLLIEHVFGTSDPEDEIIRRASPVTHVSSDDSPFLIIHGDKDDQVLLSQSEELYRKLVESGVPTELIVVKNSGHDFTPIGGDIDPSRSEITTAIGNFFDQYLKNNPDVLRLLGPR